MQPMGREKIKFPSKRKEWFGKGVKMWWEDEREFPPSKKRERQFVKKYINNEIKILDIYV